MKRLIGFSDPFIAKRLHSQALRNPERNQEPLRDEVDVWLLRTPTEGIAAFSEAPDADLTVQQFEAAIAPWALCDAWKLYFDAELGQVRRARAFGDDGNPLQLRVSNLADEAIPGKRWIGATRFAGGTMLIDWMICDG